MRSPLLALLLVLALAAATGCKRHDSSQASSAPSTLVDLSPSLDPARAAFNAHKGEPRFLAIMSPT